MLIYKKDQVIKYNFNLIIDQDILLKSIYNKKKSKIPSFELSFVSKVHIILIVVIVVNRCPSFKFNAYR